MGQIEPGDREEMLLAGILNGDTETNIEPGSRKEMLLKAILENGGGKKYQHNITSNIAINGGRVWAAYSIVNDSNTALDYDAIAALLYSSGFVSNQKLCGVSGMVKKSDTLYPLLGVYSSAGTTITISYNDGTEISSTPMQKDAITVLKDVVIEI